MTHRRPGPAWCIALLIAWLASAAIARAQSWPAASSMIGQGPSPLTHAWVVMPTEVGASGGSVPSAGRGDSETSGLAPSSPPPGCYLVHIPSRRGPPTAGPGLKGATSGTVRVATRLADFPAGLAAVNNRVYLVTEDKAPAGLRRVFSLAAVPSGIGDLWSFSPPDRLATMPSLPSGGRLAGFAGSPLGPIALIDHLADFGHDAATPRPSPSDLSARYHLLLLDDDGWRPIALPALEPGATPMGLVPVRDGLALLITGPNLQPGAWIASAQSAGTADPALTWQRHTWPAWGTSVPSQGPLDSHSIIQSGGIWVRAVPNAQSMELWSAENDRWFNLAGLGPVTPESAIVPLDDVGRIAVIWRGPRDASAPPDADAPTGNRSAYQIAEISAATGRVYYTGLARAKGPISWGDFRLLSLVLLAIMAVVLVIVARSERPDAAVVLPDGLSLAEPGQRFIAGLLDFIVCGSIAFWLWDVSWVEAANPIWILSARGEWTLLTWIGVGLLVCTLSEAWFGVSPGKILTGIGVVSSRPLGADKGAKPRRKRGIGLRAALTRNAIKWVLTPLAVLGLLGDDSRHFGDLFAGTAVVQAPKPIPRS